MRFALISMGDSGTLQLNNILKDKLDLTLPWENHLYPDELLKRYGTDTKVIFITRNIKDLIKLVEDKKDDNNWISGKNCIFLTVFFCVFNLQNLIF